MKSIEERANKFALEKHPYSPFYEENTKMYIEIATEEKEIIKKILQEKRDKSRNMNKKLNEIGNKRMVLYYAGGADILDEILELLDKEE